MCIESFLIVANGRERNKLRFHDPIERLKRPEEKKANFTFSFSSYL